MLYIKALHIIFMVAWFAGLFYLPRLFVYHADTQDMLGDERFKRMERRLYYGIMWPSGLLTSATGGFLLWINLDYYLEARYMHVKFALIWLVWAYHLVSGHYMKQFSRQKNTKHALFFRIFNEVPTILLIAIVMLVVVKPF